MAERCRHIIVKEWPGHTAHLWRRQCKNRTTNENGYCHQHYKSHGSVGWPRPRADA